MNAQLDFMPTTSLNQRLQYQWSHSGQGFTPRGHIVQLWNSFPSLVCKNVTVENWDAEKIKESIGCMSSGQAWAAGFVLSVWNAPAFRDQFTLDRAMAKWDERHRAAFADWCLNPWWP